MIFAKKALWRFKTMLDLAKIFQGVFLGKNATFPHYHEPCFAKKIFSPNSTRPNT